MSTQESPAPKGWQKDLKDSAEAEVGTALKGSGDKAISKEKPDK